MPIEGYAAFVGGFKSADGEDAISKGHAACEAGGNGGEGVRNVVATEQFQGHFCTLTIAGDGKVDAFRPSLMDILRADFGGSCLPVEDGAVA